MTNLDLDAIQADLNLIFVSDDTSGSNKVARLLNSVPALIAEVKALRGEVAVYEGAINKALYDWAKTDARVNRNLENDYTARDSAQPLVNCCDRMQGVLASVRPSVPTTGEPDA